MSEEPLPPTPTGDAAQPSEEELRAALEEEMRRVHVGDVLLQSVVSLINLGARRTGSTPQTEEEKDLEQARLAIDAAAALVPSVERVAPEQVPSINDALSQLRLAWVKAGGQAAEADAPADTAAGTGTGSPADGRDDQPGGQGGGRIWVPPGVR